jgi:hypothetical protein
MAQIGRNRQQWTTVKWLNQQERPIQCPVHNPKVAGSNPSPAIECSQEANGLLEIHAAAVKQTVIAIENAMGMIKIG